MLSQWIEGCTVQRIVLGDHLAIDLGDYNELVVFVPLRLTLPPQGDFAADEVIIVDPSDVPASQRALFDFAGSTCTVALYDEVGHLHLEFSSGHHLDVAAHGRVTAWELYGKFHGYMACLPQGRVRVVRHDVPEGSGGVLTGRADATLDTRTTR